MLRHTLLLIALLLTTFTAHADITLVDAGQPKAVIISGESPSAKAASKLLAVEIARISGVHLSVTSKAPTGTNIIAVGESELTHSLNLTTKQLKPGGFIIKSVDHTLILAGNDGDETDPDGTLHAVTTFLEQSLDVRYLWPGELGHIAPPQRTITIGSLDLRSEPAIPQRKIRSSHYNERIQTGLDYLGLTKEEFEATHAGRSKKNRVKGEVGDDWFAFQKLGGNAGLTGGHAFGYTWEKYHAQHPDWFALQPNGSRDLTNLSPHRARLCKSNIALIDALAADKIEELKTNGGRSVSLCLNDGGAATFCQCENCKKLDAPEGRKITLWDRSQKPYKDFEYVSLTDRHVWFWNQLADRITKQYPNAWLTVYAYSVYKEPPIHQKLHPNLAVGFVGGSYASDTARDEARNDWLAWSKMASKLYWRPNVLLVGGREGTPVNFTHKLAEDVRTFAAHGLVGTDFDSCQHFWATEGLSYYVLAKLLWDPAADVDAIIDDYCRAGFGPAAPQIKRYFARIEQITSSIAADNSAAARTKDMSLSLYYPPAVTSELGAILDEANVAANGDAPIKQRIAFLRTAIDFVRLQYATHKLIDGREEKLPAAEKAELMKLQQEKWLFMRRIVREQPLAINVAAVAWGGEGAFRKFGFTGAASVPKTLIDADENGRPIERSTTK